MERKKKTIIAIVVISIVTAGVLISLIPVFMYGLGVNALSVDMSFGLLGDISGSSGGSYETKDFGGLSTLDVDVNSVRVNSYEYFFRQFEGDVKHDGTRILNVLNQYVDFTIYINITTPNAQTYELTYTLEDIINILNENINILLGPDEIEIVNGTYSISIGVEVTISIPLALYEETFYFGPLMFNVDVVVE